MCQHDHSALKFLEKQIICICNLMLQGQLFETVLMTFTRLWEYAPIVN